MLGHTFTPPLRGRATVPASPNALKEVLVRFIVRLLVLACLAAAVCIPAASAADRMWVGFHDDPVLRFDGGRTEAMDRARGNGAAVVRTLVEWQKVAPTQSHDSRPTRSTPRTSSTTSTSSCGTHSSAAWRF